MSSLRRFLLRHFRNGLACVVVVACAGSALRAEVPLQEIRELQVKAATDPFEPQIVRSSGVVTWVDPLEGKLFQMQDQRGGMQVSFTNDEWPQLSDIVEVEGTLERGPYMPVISNARFIHKGKGTRPEKVNTSGGGLLNGENNGLLVDVHGHVRTAEMVSPTTFSALLISGSARITVRVSNARGLDPAKLIAARVWVRGVAVPVRARGGLKQLVDVQVLASSKADFNLFDPDPCTSACSRTW